MVPITQAAEGLIQFHDVGKDYATPSGVFSALQGVSFQVQAGEMLGVVGKSGSGKSTLLNLMTGIDRPSRGDIRVAGTQLRMLNEAQLAAWRGRSVGVVFQFFQLLPTLTVAENVVLPMEFSGVLPRAQRRKRALHLLAGPGQ